MISISKSKFTVSLLLVIACFSDIFYVAGLSNFTSILTLLLIFLLLTYYTLTEVVLVCFVFLIMYTMFYVGVLKNSHDITYFILPLLVFIGISLNKLEINWENYRSFIIAFLLCNLIALVIEKYTGRYLLDFDHPFYLFQGQGLFGWSKVQGEFLIAISLFFRRDRMVTLILLCSALLSGVRAAILLIGLISFIQLLNIKITLSYLRRWYSILSLVIIGYFFIPVLVKTFDDYNIERFTTMLNFGSSTYSIRAMVHNWHLDCISDYGFLYFMIGKGSYCTKLFEWGAESTIIHVIEYYGFIVFSFLVFLISYWLWVQRKFIDYSWLVLIIVICIYMWNWRFGFTFQGILVWHFIFLNRKNYND